MDKKDKRPLVLIVGYDKDIGHKIKDGVNGIGCLGIPVLSHEVPLKMLDTFTQAEIVVINFWLREDGAVDVMRTIRERNPEIKIIATVKDEEPPPTGLQVVAEYLVDPLRDDALANKIKDLLKG
jgi:two-component SAPR family response regulator